MAYSTKEGAPCQKVSPPEHKQGDITRRTSQNLQYGVVIFLESKLFRIFLESWDFNMLSSPVWIKIIWVFLWFKFLFIRKCILRSLYPSHLPSCFIFPLSVISYFVLSLFLRCQHLTFHLCGRFASLFFILLSALICLLPSLCLLSVWWWWMGPMDEWSVRGAVMKTGLGGESKRCVRVCLGWRDESEAKVGYAERRWWRRSGWRWWRV